MSKFKKIAILSMMLFLLTGCASQLKNGTVIVVEKEYHKPYTTTTFLELVRQYTDKTSS